MQENTKENYSINERISQIIEYLGKTRYKIAQETGISEAILNNIDKNKNKASIDVVEKILNNYIVINPEWLVTGRGSMLKQNPSNSDQEEKNITKQDFEQVEEENIKYLKQINTLYEKITSLQDMIITLKDQLNNQAESEEEPKNKLLSQLIDEAVEEFEKRASGEEYSDIEKSVG